MTTSGASSANMSATSPLRAAVRNAHLRVGDNISDIAIPLGYTIVMSAAAVLRGATIDANR